MKKIFTLACAALITAGTVQAQKITSVTVDKKADLTTAINDAATLSPGDIAFIYIKGSINFGSFTFPATTRNIHFVGIDDEETGNQASLLAEFVFPSNEAETDKFAVTFENLNLQDNNGVWGNSKHFMNFKDANKHFVDSLVFRNCDINNICRSFVRGEIYGAPTDGTYTGAGTFNYFEMTNCTFHNAFRQSNAMPMVYMSQPTNRMIFRNNTFYDMPYLNSFVTYAYMTEDTGRQNINFTFENNTVVSLSRNTLFSFGEYVTSESEFHIKNNFFLAPDWTGDECNNRAGDTRDAHDMSPEANQVNEEGVTTFGYLTQDEVNARIEKGSLLTNILGGLLQLEKNVLYGYRHQNINDEIIPIGDTENEEDDISFYTMDEAQFSWADFTDAQNDMFQINDQHFVHSAGVKGAPLGDMRNYTDKVIKELAVNIKVEGSSTVSYTIEPLQEKYFTGNKITITLIDHNNALRTLNTFKGWSDGSMETVRQIELTGDLDLTATYEAAISGIVSWFDFTQTPTAGQNKLASYEADVFAEGNQAVATMCLLDETTGEYITADGSENRFNWRAGKFGEDDAAQQVCVLSRKTPATARALSRPDYLVFTFSTKDLKGLQFSAFCGTDNFGYKTQLADWSLDGKTWTNFARVDLVPKDAVYSIGAGKHWGWTELKGALPEAVENQETVYVRVIGDATGEVVTNEVSEIDQETAGMFEYTGAVLITTTSGHDGIETLRSDEAQQTVVRYNLSGQKVGAAYKGVVIANGKKLFAK